MIPSYLEIGAPDSDAAQSFFSGLFGWSYTGMEGGGVFDTGDIVTGLHGDDPNPGIVVYFEVADLEIAIEKVRALGGTAEEPTPEEPGFGRFSSCRDPQGIRFGLRQR